MRLRNLILLALLLAGPVLGCGDGGGGTAPPPPSDIGGTWTFSTSNLHATVNGILISCKSSGTILNLVQAGGNFDGTYSGGTATCTAQGQTITEPFGSGSIVNGTYANGHVEFDMDVAEFHFVGSAAGTTMSGTCTLDVDLGSPIGMVQMTGNWRASR